MIVAMRCTLLLCLILLAGCPRMSNETVPMPRVKVSKPAPMAPTSRKQLDSATQESPLDVPPPIPWLELGTGFSAAPIPADVLAEHPTANISRDKSRLQTDDAAVWLQAFTSKGSAREVTNYYNSLLTVKEFTPLEAPASSPATGRRSRQPLRKWRSAELRYEVQLFDSGAQQSVGATQDDPRPIYVVEVREAESARAVGGTGP
jgi:hypothetical protein